MLSALRRLLADLERLILAAFNSKAAWALAIKVCLDETIEGLAVNPYEGVAIGVICFGKLILVARELNAPPRVQQLVAETHRILVRIQLSQTGGTNMACATTHKVSTVAQGPGVCCAAFSASGLTPAVGVRVVATNKLGKCIVCEIKASTSKKNPGVLVFKRGKASVPGSTVSCPSTAEGCCALIGQ